MYAATSKAHQTRVERGHERAVKCGAARRCENASHLAPHHRRLARRVHAWNAVQQCPRHLGDASPGAPPGEVLSQHWQTPEPRITPVDTAPVLDSAHA